MLSRAARLDAVKTRYRRQLAELNREKRLKLDALREAARQQMEQALARLSGRAPRQRGGGRARERGGPEP